MEHKIWECKIGMVGSEKLPNGSDMPMRVAVEDAYHRLTGSHAAFCFSGWGAEMTAHERNCVYGGGLPDWHYRDWQIQQMAVSLRKKPVRQRLAVFLLRCLGGGHLV